MERLNYNPESENPHLSEKGTKELELDKIPELTKGPGDIYYLKIPRVEYDEKYRELLDRKNGLDAILQKRNLAPKQEREYKEIETEIKVIEKTQKGKEEKQLRDLVDQAHKKEFGPGVKYYVKTPTFKGRGFGTDKVLKLIIPIGLRACKSLADGESVDANQIVIPYDPHHKIQRLAGMGSDNLDARSYFVEVYQSFEEKSAMRQEDLDQAKRAKPSRKNRFTRQFFYK